MHRTPIHLLLLGAAVIGCERKPDETVPPVTNREVSEPESSGEPPPSPNNGMLRDIRPLPMAGWQLEWSRWVDGDYWCACSRKDGKRSGILRWKDLNEPPEVLAEIDGRTRGARIAPDDKSAIVFIAKPKPATWLVPFDGTTPRKLRDGKDLTAANGMWSPDGRRVALGNYKHGVVVYDVASGDEVARIDGSVEAVPTAWTSEGLLLSGSRMKAGGSYLDASHKYFRWKPGEGEPEAVDPPPVTTPDGDLDLIPVADGVQIKGPEGRALFGPPDHVSLGKQLRQDVLANHVAFVGDRHVLVRDDATYLVDLESLAVRQVATTPYQHTSFTVEPGGRRVILHRREMKWATLAID